jgi:DNA-directed RNA polymerase specialized sigma24 family protein
MEVKMLGASKAMRQDSTRYAVRADFCRIFQQDMNRLYLLSFLLTGDKAMAERCFIRGLDDSARGNPVFKEWAQAWARRTIIQNAIQMIRPRPAAGSTPSSELHRGMGCNASEPAEIVEILMLPTFDRFVFVLSVLDRYSDQECSLLLDCTRSELVSARTRALQQIGTSEQLSRKVVNIGAERPLPDVTLAASA